MARLRELVLLVRRMVTASEQDAIGRYEGEFWRTDLRGVRPPPPVRPTIPIALAPLRAASVELAAEIGDAILGHPAWSLRWIDGEVREAVERGLARHGRSRRALRISAWLRVAVTDDREQGRRDAKVGIPFYAGLAQYDSYFAALGHGDAARALQALAAEGAPAEVQAAAVSDEMAEDLVVIGSVDEVAARLAPVLDVVDDLCLAPPSGLRPERTAAYAGAIAASLWPRPGPAA